MYAGGLLAWGNDRKVVPLEVNLGRILENLSGAIVYAEITLFTAFGNDMHAPHWNLR